MLKCEISKLNGTPPDLSAYQMRVGISLLDVLGKYQAKMCLDAFFSYSDYVISWKIREEDFDDEYQTLIRLLSAVMPESITRITDENGEIVLEKVNSDTITNSTPPKQSLHIRPAIVGAINSALNGGDVEIAIPLAEYLKHIDDGKGGIDW